MEDNLNFLKMEDDLNLMEDDLNYFQIEDNFNIFVNGKQPQFLLNGNYLNIFVNGSDL
jgi:hypothetical protein